MEFRKRFGKSYRVMKLVSNFMFAFKYVLYSLSGTVNKHLGRSVSGVTNAILQDIRYTYHYVYVIGEPSTTRHIVNTTQGWGGSRRLRLTGCDALEKLSAE